MRRKELRLLPPEPYLWGPGRRTVEGCALSRKERVRHQTVWKESPRMQREIAGISSIEAAKTSRAEGGVSTAPGAVAEPCN